MFGANIAGVLGGLVENAPVVPGFQHLLSVAAVFGNRRAPVMAAERSG